MVSSNSYLPLFVKIVKSGRYSFLFLNFTVSGLTLTSTTPTTGSAIRVRKAGRVYLDRLQILSHGIGVFHDTEGFDIFLSQSQLRANRIGIKIDAGSAGTGFFGSQLVINQVGSPTTNQGIVWTSGSGVYFNQVDIRAADDIGILLNPGAADNVLWGFFTDVLSDSSTSIGWSFSGSGNIFSVHLTDCWAASGDSTGIQFDNSNIDGVYLTGFRSLDNDGHGLFINNTGGGLISVMNSIFAGNSSASTNTNHGAVVTANATNFKFIGNRFGPDAGRADSQNTGLKIIAGTSNNYQIIGNDFRGNLTAQFTDSGTGTTKQIFGNIPAGTNTIEGASVFNESGADVDTRVEGDTDANLLYMNAGNDRVGIGTATPAGKFQVVGNILYRNPESFTNADATPSVSSGNVFATTGTTAITDFTDGVNGQVIFIRATASITITNSGTLQLNGNADYTMTDTDTLILIRMASAWFEVGRSVN